MKEESYDYLFKIVLIGDSGVGKSNILSRFKDNKFTQQSKPTIGVEFETKTIEVNSVFIKTQIWDTAGQERFRAITNAYYKGAVGAIVVYDITKPKTFQNLAKWVEQLNSKADENIVIMIVGNKVDLADNREVKTTTGQDFARQNGYLFLQTSAATSVNVTQAFHNIINKILSGMKIESKKRQTPTNPKPNSNITDPQPFPNGKNQPQIDIGKPKPPASKKQGCC